MTRDDGPMSEFADQSPHECGTRSRTKVQRWRVAPAAVAASIAALALTGCQVSDLSSAPHLEPIPSGLERRIERMNMDVDAPILLRIFKEESALEVWKEDRSGTFRRLKEYEICAWAGELGPKIREGDRQSPEGFYTVTPGYMNPNSDYHLSFNLGFPNRYDRANDRTGSFLMVHGDCSSAGCYAVEDAQIQEIYGLAREAFEGGQRAFQVQAFPFRMTPENMARHRDSEHFAFWEMLKTGSDHFEVTNRPPDIDVCGQRYVFNATPTDGAFAPRRACPSYRVRPDVERLVASKRASDAEARAAEIERIERRENRDDRWEDREAAIAAFFNQDGAAAATGPQVPGSAGESRTARATVTASGVPVPQPSPRSTVQTAGESRGFSFPNPFSRRDADTPDNANQDTAAIRRDRTDRPAPVASTSGVDVTRPAPPRQQAPRDEAGSEEKRGFFGRMANGTRNLVSGAGSLFN